MWPPEEPLLLQQEKELVAPQEELVVPGVPVAPEVLEARGDPEDLVLKRRVAVEAFHLVLACHSGTFHHRQDIPVVGTISHCY